ncbi:ATP-binding protein [Nocardioides zeae]|uniref:histidine kinase n=1 Tax=Nocardioides imazamoxiresistens TaxID=3231893 RepID=A0ABU3PS69_9ACTN|nr:ATP-binding protein [Nocardioides zeae]MDT9592068.1 ATP-binding protein [Nocardioides zeae]
MRGDDLHDLHDQTDEATLDDLRLELAVLRAAVSAPTPAELVAAVVELAREHLGATVGVARIHDGPFVGLLHVAPDHVWPASGTGALSATTTEGSRALAARCWERREAHVLTADEVLSGDTYARADRMVLAGAVLQAVGRGVDEAMVVGVGEGEECFGVLALVRPTGAPAWTRGERASAVRLGRDLGAVLRRSTLPAPVAPSVAPQRQEVAGVRPGVAVADGAVDLSTSVHRVVADQRVLAGAGGVRVSAEVADGLRVRGEALDVELLVSNLVTNGVRYTDAGGEVDVRLERVGADVVLDVEDTGHGIAEVDQRHLLAPRDGSGPDVSERTGSGLAIVRQALERLGGTIDVEARAGHGSRFTVRLPSA